MSRELAVQFARENIRVNALCPGPVETPLLLNIFGDDPAALERRRIALADRPPRQAARGRQRRAVPRLRRVVVRERLDVPRRRRPDRRLRDARVMRVCLMIEGQEGVSWEQWLALAQAAEAANLDGLFRSDHYRSIVRGEPAGSLDAWATLAGARRGDRAHPARHDGLAGHVPPRVGAREDASRPSTTSPAAASSSGSAPAGTSPSTRPTASPFPPLRERLDELDRQLAEIVRHWRRHADIQPKPLQKPRPPIIVGGTAKPRTVRAAVAHADEYNTVWPTVDEARERKRAVDDAARAAGREPLRFSMMTSCVVGRRRGRPEAAPRRRSSGVDGQRRAADRRARSSEVVAQLREYEAAGVERVMLQHMAHEDVAMVNVLGDVAAQLG